MNEHLASNLPRHIAIIMDGNGRWAQGRLLNRVVGHKKGLEVVKDIITFCREIGIGCLTLYTFSKENWNRPRMEVKALMGLLKRHLALESATMMKNNIQFKAIGNIRDLPKAVQKVVYEVEKLTSHNDGMLLQIALSYSGRDELVEAAKALALKVSNGQLSLDEIDEKCFSNHLYTADVPDPDLLVRTSGEMRISNFLLWQLAYTEIYVTDVLWPDFTRGDLEKAIVDFQNRDRRFGLVRGTEAS